MPLVKSRIALVAVSLVALEGGGNAEAEGGLVGLEDCTNRK